MKRYKYNDIHNTYCFRNEIYFGIKFQLILMLKNIKMLNLTAVQYCAQYIARKGCQLTVYNGYSTVYPSTKFGTLTPADLELHILNIETCSQVGPCQACILTRCVSTCLALSPGLIFHICNATNGRTNRPCIHPSHWTCKKLCLGMRLVPVDPMVKVEVPNSKPHL